MDRLTPAQHRTLRRIAELEAKHWAGLTTSYERTRGIATAPSLATVGANFYQLGAQARTMSALLRAGLVHCETGPATYYQVSRRVRVLASEVWYTLTAKGRDVLADGGAR